ncbi:RMD1 family protein [Sphingomonas sp. MMSM24]|uniref:RMD1 family protein n=1 Tax=Sphingomonas lycopersici TaxID=2951807 RepID=A0AA41Z8J9_9SPHN|nr:RMD1 family protein [Sphingomonas lycopersici]
MPTDVTEGKIISGMSAWSLAPSRTPVSGDDDMPHPVKLSPRPLATPDFLALGETPANGSLRACASLVGGQIDTSAAQTDPAIAALIKAAGLVFLFRYGVVVTVGARDDATLGLVAALRPHIADPTALNERESALIEHDPGAPDNVGAEGQIRLADLGRERLTLVAIVLARSVALARDEFLLWDAFDRIAPLVTDLQENGRARLPIRSAMQLVGNVLAARHRIIGTAQVDERPDLLWDHPALDRLYTRLEAEYELKERADVVQRKLDALGGFTEALLDIVQDKRAFRVEIAVIALIAFEVALSLLNLIAR